MLNLLSMWSQRLREVKSAWLLKISKTTNNIKTNNKETRLRVSDLYMYMQHYTVSVSIQVHVLYCVEFKLAIQFFFPAEVLLIYCSYT